MVPAGVWTEEAAEVCRMVGVDAYSWEVDDVGAADTNLEDRQGAWTVVAW